MRKLEATLIIFLFGFCMGALLAMSVKYPLSIENLNKHKVYCENSSIDSVKIGLSGDIYEVKCSNGLVRKTN